MYLHTKWEEIPLSPMQGRGGFCITDKNSKTGMNSSFVPVLPVPVYNKEKNRRFLNRISIKGECPRSNLQQQELHVVWALKRMKQPALRMPGQGRRFYPHRRGRFRRVLLQRTFKQPEGRVRNSERLLRIVQGRQALCGMCQARALTNLPVGM